MVKALLAEDNRKISNNIKDFLKDEFDIDAVYNGKEAMEYLNAFQYDIVILDLMLPEIDGLTILTDIRERSLNTAVIILTAKENISDKLRAFRIGVNDYLTKPFFLEELKARMYAILRAMNKVEDKNILTFKNLRMDVKIKNVYAMDGNGQKTVIILPDKLFSLLEYFMLNKDIILLKEQIFDRICGSESDATEQVIEVYISHLRKKLAEFGLDRYLVTKRGMGYVLNDN